MTWKKQRRREGVKAPGGKGGKKDEAKSHWVEIQPGRKKKNRQASQAETQLLPLCTQHF